MTPSTSQSSIAGMTEMTKSVDNMAKREDVKHMIQKIVSHQESNIRDNEQTLRPIERPVETVSSPPISSAINETIEELKEKNKDLESKLDTLRVRRAQDKEKFKDFERIRIQCEQLQENKRQMSEKIAELSKLKAIAEKEAKEARKEQLRHAEEMKDLVETAEMAVIDKEMTENKLEQCQLELDQTKEKLEEVTLDLEILKNEIEEKGTDGAVSSYQLKQLEQQNERLKDALLKLRDISAQDKNELQSMQKELDKTQNECIELLKVKEKLSAEAAQYEETIADLKVLMKYFN
jgi:dynactin 1